MRYKELLEEAEQITDKLFYHVTTKRRVRSIMQHGIVSDGHHRRWKNITGGKQGNRGYVYLISDFIAALKWAANMDYDLNVDSKKPRQKIVILCLSNISEDEIEPDPNVVGKLQAPGTWFQLEGGISPQNITKIIDLTPDMVNQVVQAADHAGAIGMSPV